MLTIERAKQIALFTAMASAMVYKFLEEIDAPKVRVINGGKDSVQRRKRGSSLR